MNNGFTPRNLSALGGRFRAIMILKCLLLLLLLFAGRAAAFPLSAKDASGYTLNLSRMPQRIISTIPSNTEIVFSLGLDKRVIAVSDSCNYPLEAARRPRIGGIQLNLEKIIKLKPDLIISLYDAQKLEIARLRQHHLPVFALSAHSLKEVMSSILTVGKITGADQAAREVVGEMRRKVDAVRSRVQTFKKRKPRVLAIVWPNPLTSVGEGTFMDDLIKLAGGENVAAGMPGAYPFINAERILAADPDIIMVPVESEEKVRLLVGDPFIRGLRAAKGGMMVYIDSDILFRPGPRLADALETLADFIEHNWYQKE